VVDAIRFRYRNRKDGIPPIGNKDNIIVCFLGEGWRLSGSSVGLRVYDETRCPKRRGNDESVAAERSVSDQVIMRTRETTNLPVDL